MGIFANLLDSRFFKHPLLIKYTALVNEDLTATYSRDIQKWLLAAPIIGILTGLIITGIAVLVLDVIWGALLPYYLGHHWAIVVGLVAGFFVTGLIMQFCTPEPDEHSTEEIVRSYHEHQGDIDIGPFWWKLLAAVTTVGSGGSAALEGPSIYSGGAIGSWLWIKLRRFGLEMRDRRIMLISGAAAGMSAVFRAPLTGIVFALEMPYKDDLAHEALLPSLIASVVAYATLVSIVGAQPLFGFAGSTSFRARDIWWSALLGAGIGLIAIVFDITFRRVRGFFITSRMPHWLKLTIGGLGTALCGLAFVAIYDGPLIPIGPNYEAVRYVLKHSLPTEVLLAFVVLKLLATIFTLGTGGVSAMFVPLLLVGGAIGNAYAQSVVHSPTHDLYAAVGMAAFIAAGYKTPLTAVVFVAETTGGHSYIIPSLIGAAVAYAISGEASVSGDQHLHETAKLAELSGMFVRDVMQHKVISAQATSTIRELVESVAVRHKHTIFPVSENEKLVGTISISDLSEVPPSDWDRVTVGELADRDAIRVTDDCDLSEALRLLVRERGSQMLLVIDETGALKGVLTKTDILRAVRLIDQPAPARRITRRIPTSPGPSGTAL
ncbi:chloride channel protein [Candidatus Binatus sp.]|uniref:chloride channel protein n=1 Tax=Candidatus Binatus sp. TaxID=2811406 RepID=UPI003BB206B2